MTRSLFHRLCAGSGPSGYTKGLSGHAAKRKAWLQVETLEERAVPTGTWMTLANPIPGDGAQTMMLLSDGSVMVQGGKPGALGGKVGSASSAWYKLTPDSTGSYIQGTWSQLASMNTARYAFPSNVLMDGRVFVLGGEFSGQASAQTWINTGEIYDPAANIWSKIAAFPQSQFGDDPTVVLPNGEVFAGYLNGPDSYIYDPSRNLWSTTGFKLRDDSSDEETWLKLPDDSILSYDIFASTTNNKFEAQRFIPSKDEWVDASTLDPNNPPSVLSTANEGYELGPAFLLPNGNAIFFGAKGNTAIYSPSTDTWTAGPSQPMVSLNGNPTQLVMADAPGAMMPNGDILLALAPLWDNSTGNIFPSPTYIYEFDPTTNTYTDVTPANFDLNKGSVKTTMLVLPSGQVMLTNDSPQVDIFMPDGVPNPSWQPTISNIIANGDNAFTLTGTQLNGISEGASYGDDFEMDSNYPIIRLTDAKNNVSFARSFNWSSTGVATGSTPESVEFTLPAGLAPGPYLVSVIANGIASARVLDVLPGSVDTKLALQVDVNDPGSIDVSNNGSLLGEFPVSFFSSIIVTAGNTDNTIAIDNTFSGVPLTVNEGTGHGSISVSAGDLDAIQGPVTVNGGVADSLVLDDRNFHNPRTFTVTASTIVWGGPTVDYSGVGSLRITGGSGGNTFNVLSSSAATILTIFGRGRGDTLVGSNAGNLFTITSSNTGTLLGSAYGSSVQFSLIGNLTAGSGGDVFQFAAGATLSGKIVGSGSDTLDYSAYYSGNVIVDLQTGFATGVIGSVSGIGTVLGCTARQPGHTDIYNLLIGNGGNTLVGGFGRTNILVAGPKASTLEGALAQDLLIGGSTTYDTEAGLGTWQRIAAYWASGAPFATRVAHLTSGTGVPLLDATVVMGNGGGNTFIGNGGLALLFTDGMDKIGLFDPGSQQVPIVP